MFRYIPWSAVFVTQVNRGHKAMIADGTFLPEGDCHHHVSNVEIGWFEIQKCLVIWVYAFENNYYHFTELEGCMVFDDLVRFHDFQIQISTPPWIFIHPAHTPLTYTHPFYTHTHPLSLYSLHKNKQTQKYDTPF